MDLLLNDLSFQGQFQAIDAFKDSISRVMALRQIAKRFGREILCHRSLALARATQGQTVPQVIRAFEMDEARALMQWITRHGPFWEDLRLHGGDDYLEYNGTIVTDTALGEAAFGNLHGQERHLVSLTPSSFNHSPLQVTWTPGDRTGISVDVCNHWTPQQLEATLNVAPRAIDSWAQLDAACRMQFDGLTFSDDCFDPLVGHPFVDGAARQVLTLLGVLDRFVRCFDEDGNRTQDGQQIYQDHFTGDKSWFSDSSDSEKADFRNELSFNHPHAKGATLNCTWHGKVKTPQIRVHFSWPIKHNEPLFVVYVGPKITKR